MFLETFVENRGLHSPPYKIGKKCWFVMDLFLRLVITLIVAAIGGIIALKLKVPAGGMTGALIAVIIFNVFTNIAYVPSTLRTFIQMFMGALIGCKIRKRDIHELRLCIKPTIMMLIFMVIYNFIFGMIIYSISDYDIITSLLSVAPGGMTDMPLIAADMGGDQTIVALMQLIRMVFIFSFITPTLRKIGLKEQHQAESPAEEAAAEAELALAETIDADDAAPETKPVPQPAVDVKRIPELILTAVVAVIGGTILWQLDVMAGAIIGSMLATTALGISTGKGYFPQKFRLGIQIFVGAYLGSQVTAHELLSLKSMPIPLIIMVLGILSITFGLSALMLRTSKLSHLTCLLVCTPGGLQEMTLVADELGGDAAKVAVMQTARLIVVISTFPIMVGLLSHFLGG